MKGKKRKQQFLLDKFLVLLAIICIILAGLMIAIYLDNAEMSIFAKSGNQMKQSYTSEVTNEWDVSEAGDGSVIATLSDDGTLTISGTGNMANWYDETPWYSEKDLIKEIIIKEGVTSIGDGSFCECYNVTNIEIPEGVTVIGDWAFVSCYILKNIEIPSSVISIGPDAFYCCYMLQNIKVKEENTKYCDLDGVLYSKDKTEILKYPISKTGTEYTILNSVTKIGYSAFEECLYLMKINIPENVTNIGDYAFSYCESLTSIKIPSNVIDIGNYAFEGTIITNLISAESNVIELPDILKRSQEENDIAYIFTNCIIEEGKIKITDGETYATIEVENGTFDGLTYIISYYSWDISANEDKTVIATLDENGVLTISGTGLMKDWANNVEVSWCSVNHLIKSVNIKNGVTNIGNNAFWYCRHLTSVEIPNSVTSIGTSAFECCYELKKIKIPTSVTSVGDYAFGYCESLVNIEIPSSVTSIGESAFESCEALTSVKIQNGVTSIKEWAFCYCESLTGIVIPNSVTTIGDSAFYNCANLTILCYNDSVAATYAQENDINYLMIMDEIQTKTTVQQIKQKMGNSAEYKITNKNGETIVDDKQLTTGCKIESSNGENYIIIVEGDTNGDGNADIRDILAINKYRLNKANLEVECLLASDVNEDDTVDIRDILQINKFRLGKTESL